MGIMQLEVPAPIASLPSLHKLAALLGTAIVALKPRIGNRKQHKLLQVSGLIDAYAIMDASRITLFFQLRLFVEAEKEGRIVLCACHAPM